MRFFRNKRGGAIAQPYLTISAVKEYYWATRQLFEIRSKKIWTHKNKKKSREGTNYAAGTLCISSYSSCRWYFEATNHWHGFYQICTEGTIELLCWSWKPTDAVPSTITWVTLVIAVQKDLLQWTLSSDSHGVIVEYRDQPGSLKSRKKSKYSDPPNLRTPTKIIVATPSSIYKNGVDTRPEWILTKEWSYDELKVQEQRDFNVYK